MKIIRQAAYLFAGSLMLAALGGCNTPTSKTVGAKSSQKSSAASTLAAGTSTPTGETPGSGDTSLASPNQPEADQPKEVAKIINRPGKVADRGTFIKILVNNTPITNFDIQRRIAFLKLRRVKGDRKIIAETELIDQTIKLTEAKRRGTYASDPQVKQAFAKFAKQNRTTPVQLSKELDRMGVGARHFRQFMRTQISWQGAVNRKFQADTRNLSQIDAITQIRKSGEKKPVLGEYYIQQIIFVIPESKRSAILKARTVEAKAFRQRFTGCNKTIELAKSLRDVSVVELRRVLAPEIPGAWREEVEQLGVGKTTKVRETSKGVELIAICDLKMVDDDRAAQVFEQSKEYDSFNEKGSKVSEEYLAQLREIATIIYR